MTNNVCVLLSSACLMLLSSLPTVSEADPSSARFARSGVIWGWEYFLKICGCMCFTRNLQKSLQLQKHRPIQPHNGQHKRKLNSHQAQKKSLNDFSRCDLKFRFCCSMGRLFCKWGAFYNYTVLAFTRPSLAVPFLQINCVT